jgi:crossover junction endodeoxyribonuclease RuvC
LKSTSKANIILGIDPGLTATGYGFIASGKCIDFGIVRSDSKMELGARLFKILAILKKKIHEYSPSVCVIETLFFRAVSARSVIYSAHLRGAIFLLMYQEKVPIIEVTPAKVKQILTGNGRASKQQIGFMVQRVYNIKEKVNEHACDALAVAYSFESLQRTKRIGLTR